ncbi:MAG: ribonuclease E activity regulator RraA [Pseudomonadota bacterium]
MTALEPLSTADLNDAHPGKVRRVALRFQDFGGRRRFAGPVRTAVTVEDTLLVQRDLFRTPGNGAVIVLDGGGSLNTALLGDVNADILVQNGWAGIIINGAVRDTSRLAAIDLGVKALGTSPIRSGKTGIGAIDVPVAFGNTFFDTRKYVYCDEDGILVSEEPLSLDVSGS